jgi:hypothetical protein
MIAGAEMIPIWAFMLCVLVAFCAGFEAGRMFTWLHQLWLDRRGK